MIKTNGWLSHYFNGKYVWNQENQWEPLWDDIRNVAERHLRNEIARPHFHISNRNQYSASFAIDNFDQLAGYVPTKCKKPILEWAMKHQYSLSLTWEKLQAGECIRDLVSAEKEVYCHEFL